MWLAVPDSLADAEGVALALGDEEGMAMMPLAEADAVGEEEGVPEFVGEGVPELDEEGVSEWEEEGVPEWEEEGVSEWEEEGVSEWE